MIRLCDPTQREVLIRFLEKDAVYHTFLLSDILHYGFESPFQQVYMQVSPEGDCTGVFLRFYHNLIVAGDAKTAEFSALWPMVENEVTTVMGKGELVAALQQACGRSHCTLAEKSLYTLKSDRLLLPPVAGAEQATGEDVDEIHAFLMKVPAFHALYGEKGMIENRIREDDGMHLLLRKDGRLCAHANSAAKTQLTCMVGGVAVHPELRGRGLGHQIVSELCRRTLKGGQAPCLFSDYPPGRSLFCDLGFEKIGTWGVLETGNRV